jgi:hypothetical protein
VKVQVRTARQSISETAWMLGLSRSTASREDSASLEKFTNFVATCILTGSSALTTAGSKQRNDH